MDNQPKTKPMKKIVGVRFKEKGKIYTFDASGMILSKGDKVIVNTEDGMAVGYVATRIRLSRDNKLPPNLKKVLRKATEDDAAIEQGNVEMEKEAFCFCCDRITKRGLPMKLVDVECLFDKSKIIFYFTAKDRVDFRKLVKDLVQKYKARIELRQIWVRSEARICGGIGICGRELCCTSFLKNFVPVTIKMAKEQNMLLNPEKISGLCGRLICCLSYEYDTYRDAKKIMPKCGKCVITPEGRGKVLRQNILDSTVVVGLEEGSEVVVSAHNIKKG